MIHRFRFYRPPAFHSGTPPTGRAARRDLKKDPSLFEVYSCALFAFRRRLGAAVRPSAEGGLAVEVNAPLPLQAVAADLAKVAARWGGLVIPVGPAGWPPAGAALVV